MVSYLHLLERFLRWLQREGNHIVINQRACKPRKHAESLCYPQPGVKMGAKPQTVYIHCCGYLRKCMKPIWLISGKFFGIVCRKYKSCSRLMLSNLQKAMMCSLSYRGEQFFSPFTALPETSRPPLNNYPQYKRVIKAFNSKDRFNFLSLNT